MLRGNQPVDALDVIRARRVWFLGLLSRKFHYDAIAGRVWRDPSVIENHRERRQRLADRLARESLPGEGRDEAGDYLRRDLVDRRRTERRICAVQSGAVLHGG